jgi:poly(U)-specific endoribonuclease
VQFWVEEAKGAVDYQGYLKPRNRNEVVDSNDRIISCQFKWSNVVKPCT